MPKQLLLSIDTVMVASKSLLMSSATLIEMNHVPQRPYMSDGDTSSAESSLCNVSFRVVFQPLPGTTMQRIEE